MSDTMQLDELQEYANRIRQLEYEIKHIEENIKYLSHSMPTYLNGLEIKTFLYQMDRYIEETHKIGTITPATFQMISLFVLLLFVLLFVLLIRKPPLYFLTFILLLNCLFFKYLKQFFCVEQIYYVGLSRNKQTKNILPVC